MPELENVKPVRTAGFADTSYTRSRRQAKLAREEQELQELMSGKPTEEEGEDGNEDAQISLEKETEKTVQEDSPALSDEEQTFKKRYGDLRRHASKIEARLKELEESKTEEVAPPVSPEKYTEWVKRYPDFAAMMKKMITDEAHKMYGDRFKSIEAERADLARAKAEAQIEERHPDFFTITESKDFEDWLDAQPKRVQDALYENEDDAASAIRVMDLYKLDKGLTAKAKREAAKQAATMVEKTSRAVVTSSEDKPIFKESQIMKNSDAWFEKNYDAIMLAQREGRFIQDVTKRF